MILPINKEYRITTDKWNYIIEQFVVPKTGAKAGQGDWVALSSGAYHRTLDQAVQSLHGRNIRMDDAVGVQAVLDAIERSERTITAALEVRKEQLTLI